MIGVALAALLAAAPATPQTRSTELVCGGGEFRMQSRVWPGPPAPRAPAGQSLTAALGDGPSHAVPLERGGRLRREGREVLRRYVSTWACMVSAKGAAYVLLGYACAADPGEPGACGADKEWYRLLDARGRAVDPGAPHAGPARARLLARLGLADVMAAGVPMTDVLGG